MNIGTTKKDAGKKKGLSLQLNAITHVLPMRIKDITTEILLTRSHIVQIAIMLLFAIIAVIIVVKMLILVPKPDELMIEQRKEELSASDIDELELWLEDRNTEYEQNPSIPAEAFRTETENSNK